MKQSQNKFASLSLVSMIATGTMTTIHHSYEIGFHAVILALLFIIAPISLMLWFRKTGNSAALWIYGLLNTWLVFGLSLVDGLWNHVVRPLGFQVQALLSIHGGDLKTAEQLAGGNLIYEGTGIFTFVAGMFAAYYGYKFIQKSKQFKK
jgi:hypothetical protein